jgi:hypothetical protein
MSGWIERRERARNTMSNWERGPVQAGVGTLCGHIMRTIGSSRCEGRYLGAMQSFQKLPSAGVRITDVINGEKWGSVMDLEVPRTRGKAGGWVDAA